MRKKDYNFKNIEKKWQEKWKESGLEESKDFSEKKKMYVLVEFPYPSAEGLHVGHIRSYSALDAVARKKRMEGYNVLYPIGWDAFGLPAENYAIKTGVHPEIATKKNIENYRRQINSMGLSFDWTREVNTTDPEYYKWTQWIFLKFFEHGLAYQAEMPINWCPSCKIGLANEEAVGGECERCGSITEKRNIKQWLLKITEYADRLIEDLSLVEYPERVKTQQINWIGRSFGADIIFKIKDLDENFNVFTTRVDTIFGVTALVCAPENNLIFKLKDNIKNWDEVKKYIEDSKKKSEIERTSDEKNRTGIELEGIKVINPINKEEVSVWIADYVISSYGGGAVMMVPAHDKRDFDFAKKYGIEIKEVVEGGDIKKEAFTEFGTLVDSKEFSGLSSADAIEKITEKLKELDLGRKKKNYKLRDWVFSRQHYWGEPIPIIHCEKCGPVAVKEEELPVKLPFVEKYEPTKTGESPLANIKDWVIADCPKCGLKGKRETDTMPNWAGSNWYFLAYAMKKSSDFKFPISKYQNSLKYWIPVDWYNGGMEHTTLHLLYSRFVYKFLWDIGFIPKECGSEPYKKRTSHGMVVGEDSQKMSKSRGNVINPDDITEKFGADSLRVYEMFMGPFDQAISWSTNGLIGCFRFLNRVWEIFQKSDFINKSSKEASVLINKLIKKVSYDIEGMKFNTAIASLMEFVNFLNNEKISKKDAEIFLKIISPFAPHLSEEIWEMLGNKESIFNEKWPAYNEDIILEEKCIIVVQVNGKVRDQISLNRGSSQKEAEELVFKSEKVKRFLIDKKPKNIIFVKDRLINIVI